MKITVTVRVEVERGDGSANTTESRKSYDAGDNPRYEKAEIAKAFHRAFGDAAEGIIPEREMAPWRDPAMAERVREGVMEAEQGSMSPRRSRPSEADVAEAQESLRELVDDHTSKFGDFTEAELADAAAAIAKGNDRVAGWYDGPAAPLPEGWSYARGGIVRRVTADTTDSED